MLDASRFEDLRVEVVEQVRAGDKLVVVFWQTGRQIEGLGIDVLTITEGRISQIWVLVVRIVGLGPFASP